MKQHHSLVNNLVVTSEKFNTCLEQKKIELEDEYYPNSFIVLKSHSKADKTRLLRVDETHRSANLISETIKASSIAPKNKEQCMALDMLLDDNVPVNILTGRAGSGKTLISLAVALQKIEQKKYKRIILSRPMSQVGKHNLGTLPGDVNEKFMPYLGNFETNLGFLTKSFDIEHFVQQYNVEVIPIQLMRGCSFADSIVLIDETQVLDHHEMLTIGTRVAHGSKIVIMGDLDQRDEKIDKNKTGIYKLMNSELALNSHLVGAIELLKCERGPVAEIFTKIFEG